MGESAWQWTVKVLWRDYVIMIGTKVVTERLPECRACESENVSLRKQYSPGTKQRPWYFVQCDDCGKYGEYEKSPEAAIAAWNGE